MESPDKDSSSASSDPAERARKSASILLQRLAPVGTQTAIAAAMGVSDSKISRLKEEIAPLMEIAARCGLKLVDAEKICLKESEVKFLRETYAIVSSQAPWLINETEH